MRKTTSTKLAQACRNKLLVKFTRPFEPGSMRGYVLDIGPKFLLLALMGDDGVRFNGFSCLRVGDIRELEAPSKYSEFLEAALRKLGEPMPKRPRIHLAGLPDLLRSASRHFKLITLHRERVDPNVCFIGRIEHVTEKRIFIREIGPDAIWEKEAETYGITEITRVDFGGAYEEALYLVGGDPD